MNKTEHPINPTEQRQVLLSLCRFISLRHLHKWTVLLLFATGVVLSLSGHAQFAPYGIGLITLLLPTYLSNVTPKDAKKENSASPLSFLCEKYHYSLPAFFRYHISFLACSMLLLCWHLFQKTTVLSTGISLPLLYLALHLALYPIASRILFLRFHRRLMEGDYTSL